VGSRRRSAQSSAASSSESESTTSRGVDKGSDRGDKGTANEQLASDSQRAMRHLLAVSAALVVVPFVAYYSVQALFGPGSMFGAFAAVTAVNIILIFTVCTAPQYASS